VDSHLATILVAIVVATAGLWWFQFVLKNVRKLPAVTRFGIYALVWLAYFVLTMIMTARSVELLR
jgi:hypothetical protein